MSGETEQSVSSWTVDSLHEHLRVRLDDLRDLIDERDVRYGGVAKAADEAVRKADTANEKRLDSVNEFRAQLGDVLSNTMPRKEAEASIARNAERVTELERRFDTSINSINSRLDLTAGTKQGGVETKAALYALVGFVVSLLVIGGFVAAAWPK